MKKLNHPHLSLKVCSLTSLIISRILPCIGLNYAIQICLMHVGCEPLKTCRRMNVDPRGTRPLIVPRHVRSEEANPDLAQASRDTRVRILNFV
jgi:hypothetical protein